MTRSSLRKLLHAGAGCLALSMALPAFAQGTAPSVGGVTGSLQAQGAAAGSGGGSMQLYPWGELIQFGQEDSNSSGFPSPWGVLEETPAPQTTPTPQQPEMIHPRLPSAPDYPTRDPASIQPHQQTPAEYQVALQQWRDRMAAMTNAERIESMRESMRQSGRDPDSYTQAQYEQWNEYYNTNYQVPPHPTDVEALRRETNQNRRDWETMTDAERVESLRERIRSEGFDPNVYGVDHYRQLLDAWNAYYGTQSNPVQWPAAGDWRSMNEQQRIEMMRDMLIQQGWPPQVITDQMARDWLAYYNVDSYYSAEWQQFLAQQRAINAGDIGGYLDLGGTLTTVALEAIYEDGYDPFRPGSTVVRGLSSAGEQPAIPWISLSSAGSITPSSAGSPLPDWRWGGGLSSTATTPAFDWMSMTSVSNSLRIDWGGGMSSAGNSMSLAGGFTSLNGAFGSPVTLAGAQGGAWRSNRNSYEIVSGGQMNGFTDKAKLVGFINDLSKEEIVRILRTSDASGLDRLLAQPFNVLLTWGANAYDIDLHMTGPTGTGNRFHIYYAAPGALDAFPYAALIKDCVCSSGSEVMLTTQLNKGGVYRISAFNFGDQSATSTNLANEGDVVLQIVRGGQAVSVGNGTTIVGGRTVFTGSPKTGDVGNNWTAVEIDPQTGAIRFVNDVNAVGGSGSVP